MSTPPSSPISSRAYSQVAISNSPIRKTIGAMASEVADMAGRTVDSQRYKAVLSLFTHI